MNELKIVSGQLTYPKVLLKQPSNHHYLLIAAEVDHSLLPFHLGMSARKKALLEYCKKQSTELESISGVREAITFTALVTAPGRGKFIKRRQGKVHIAKYDLVVLIEVEDGQAARAVIRSESYRQLHSAIVKAASYIYEIQATNPKRIDMVDHSHQGVFLFNYFFADNIEQNIAVWQYTAGYFQKESGLDNSTLLLPKERGEANHSIINHCRWDKLSDIMPTLLFKRSFHKYILNNFEANNTAAMPILYKLYM